MFSRLPSQPTAGDWHRQHQYPVDIESNRDLVSNVLRDIYIFLFPFVWVAAAGQPLTMLVLGLRVPY